MTDYEREALIQGWKNVHLQGVLAVGAFVLAGLAIWGDRLKKWLFAPRLRLAVELSPPYCQRFPAGIWFRVKVSNESATEATNVSVWLEEIHRGADHYPIRIQVAPIPLVWTHDALATIPVLNPHFSRFVDLGRLVPDGTQSRFILCTVPEPAGEASHLIPTGYRARLSVTASNTRPISQWFAFDVPGFLPPTEEVGLTAMNLRISSPFIPANNP